MDIAAIPSHDETRQYHKESHLRFQERGSQSQEFMYMTTTQPVMLTPIAKKAEAIVGRRPQLGTDNVVRGMFSDIEYFPRLLLKATLFNKGVLWIKQINLRIPSTR